MIVNANRLATGAIFGKCIGTHRNDGRLLVAGQGANFAGGAQAIHFRHQEIHQNQIKFLRFCEVDRNKSVIGQCQVQTGEFMEYFKRNFLVQAIIFGEQDT